MEAGRLCRWIFFGVCFFCGFSEVLGCTDSFCPFLPTLSAGLEKEPKEKDSVRPAVEGHSDP